MPIVVTTPGATSPVGACSAWATEADICEPCSDLEIDAVLMADCLKAGTDLLYYLSGEQFPGLCEVQGVRPCARPARDRGRPVVGYPGPWAGGGPWGESWWPWGYCGCAESSRVGLGGLPEVLLGQQIHSVQQVKIDGVVLDPAEYRIDNAGTSLVRVADAAGNARAWPCCQRQDLPDTAAGTFSVDYTYGLLPDRLGIRAAAVMACELALLFTPSAAGKCRLPRRVTQITRQGIAATILDPMQFIDKGRTGLTEVDLWLHAVNPSGIRRRATVASPDLGPRVRRPGF